MTAEEAERMLAEWVTVTRSRDQRIRAAVAAGVTKYRVHKITGLGRSTVDRILASAGDGSQTAQGAAGKP